MGKYTKEQTLQIIVKCSRKYKENLLNKCLMFVCTDKHKKVHWLEVSFDTSNFLHLTGVKVNNISANDFFNRCVNSRLSIDDFEMAEDSTTDLKLEVLPSVLSPNLSANSIGDYSGTSAKLYTEKLAGSVKACVGFIATEPSGRYVPNTVLNIDIRDYISSPLRIIATYRKMKTDKNYTEIVYAAKNVDWDSITYPNEIANIEKPKSKKKEE